MMTPVELGRAAGSHYLDERSRFAHDEGVAVTVAMLAQWITDAIAVAVEVGVEAARAAAATRVEAEIWAETCGAAAEPSKMCRTHCEAYGCSTLRDLAASIRRGTT